MNFIRQFLAFGLEYQLGTVALLGMFFLGFYEAGAMVFSYPTITEISTTNPAMRVFLVTAFSSLWVWLIAHVYIRARK